MKLDTAKVRELCSQKFGSKPGDRRASHGQTALAECAGISYVTLSRLLNGHTQPQADTLAGIAGALGVDQSDLMKPGDYAQPGDDW